MLGNRSRRCIIGIMLSTIVLTSSTGCSIQDKNTDGKPKNELYEINEMLTVNLRFKSVSNKEIRERFFVDTKSFFSNEHTYNHRMAKCSFALSISSFSSGDTSAHWGEDGDFGRENNLRSAFDDMKLSDQVFVGYDRSLNSSDSKAAFGIGKKEIMHEKEKCELVVLVIRGGVYGAEWADNFNIGSSGKYHVGFEKSAKYIKKYVDEYISQKCTNNKISLLITGYSRGGAIANILAAKYQSYAEKKLCVYAYTFASPNTVIKDEKINCDNIYNIIIPYDAITSLPPGEWGFAREGKDIIMPTENETEASKLIYNRLYYHLNELTGEKYNISDINKIKALREIMLMFAQTRDDFADSYQGVFQDMMTYFMTRVKKERWVNIGFKEYIYKKYSSRAKKAFEKISQNNNVISIEQAGISLPEELIDFLVLCEIHNINVNKIAISSIKMETLKNVFSAYSEDFILFTKRVHAPETYLAWLKTYDFQKALQ